MLPDEHRDFVAPQPRDAAVARGGDAGLPGVSVAPGHEKLEHFVPGVPAINATTAVCSEGDPAGTPFIRDSHDEQERCSMESFL